jgi:AcrR family transcriptional regulator
MIDDPKEGPDRRAALTAQLAEIALSDGLDALALRSAAARLGTSDRMLLYYFGTKAELVGSVLAHISGQLRVTLTAASSDARLPPSEFLIAASAMMAGLDMAPIMRVWADISARGARGEEPYRSFAARAAEGWLAWVESRIDMEPGEERRRCAAAILTVIEGINLLGISAPGLTDGVAELLAEALAGRYGGPR